MKADPARRSVVKNSTPEPKSSLAESDFVLDGEEPDPESDETEAREFILNSFGHHTAAD